MTPQEARERLHAAADDVDAAWITTERLGGTRRARERHAREEQERVAADRLRAAELRRVAGLDDVTLSWLLAQGWLPAV